MRAADPTAAAPPNADKILRASSAKLAAARQFSFKAHREIDAALLVGRDVAEDAEVEGAETAEQPKEQVPQAAAASSEDIPF